MRNKQFWYATAALLGTIVGVGVFGIPFVFAKAGFWTGFIFLIFAGLVTVIFTLLFGEVVLRTPSSHQLVGYADMYLGAFAKRLMFFASAISIYGALLAYIIVAGEFLNNVFSYIFYGQPLYYSFIFFGFVALITLFNIRTSAWVELGLSAFFIAVMLIIFGVGIGKVDLANLHTGNSAFWFLPYGVLLFAFGGLTSVPIQRQILTGRERLLKKSILLAVGVSAILYLLFAFVVVGISGDITSPDAISGLFGVLGPRIVFLGSLFGALSVTTSFIMLALALREIYHWDYKIKSIWAWLLVVIPPPVLFLGGLRNFIDVISLAGSVAIGIESVVLIFVVRKARLDGRRQPEYTVPIPSWLLYALIPVFLAGVVYALIFV